MSFTSPIFLVFVAVLVLLRYLLPKRFAWILILIANVIFYAFAGWYGFIFIAFTSFTAWILSRAMDRNLSAQDLYLAEHKKEMQREERKVYKESMKKKRRLMLVIGLLLNFGILFALKYLNFFIANVNLFLPASARIGAMKLWLPMGISFYTFQTMGYLIDVYRGKYPAEKNYFKLATFTSFFPLLVQGPITRFNDLSKTLYDPADFSRKRFSFGIQRILWGYFKKVVIADRILTAVTALIASPDVYNGSYVFFGIVFYAIQLYADFTGGIDITIGIAQLLGIDVKENFERPFFSKDIAEYWRRWHISLGEWFKDYLFYPISVSSGMLKLSRSARKKLGDKVGKKVPVYIASLSVWAITGLWHGAAWNFIVWGLLNAFVIIVSEELTPLYQKFHARFPKLKGTAPYKVFEILRTSFIMGSIRTLDCYRNVPVSFKAWFSMFTVPNLGQALARDGGLMHLGLSIADYIVVFVGVLIMLAVSLKQRGGSVREAIWQKNSPALRYALMGAMVLVILVFGAYGIGYDSAQFIYNQF